MTATENHDPVQRTRLARLRLVLLWIARSILATGWLLVVSNALSRDGLAGLLAWDALAATFALLVTSYRGLVGGLGLIAFCLLYAAYCSYLVWQKESFSADSMIAAASVGFGSIYALIAYATMAFPGGLLVIFWFLNRKARPA